MAIVGTQEAVGEAAGSVAKLMKGTKEDENTQGKEQKAKKGDRDGSKGSREVYYVYASNT